MWAQRVLFLRSQGKWAWGRAGDLSPTPLPSPLKRRECPLPVHSARQENCAFLPNWTWDFRTCLAL
jgi:hypothetical protein